MKRIIALLLALSLVFVFVGCGSKDASSNPDKSGNDLVMGTAAGFPPYEFVSDDGDVVGIDAEIAKAISKKIGKNLVIKDMDFDSLLTAVQSGSIDFVMAGLTVNEERKQSVDFTQSYATGKQVVIVKEDSPIASIDDIEGKTIGVQSGTTGDIYCTDDYGQEFVKQYKEGSLAVAALKQNQVDCVVIDNEPAKTFVAANSGLKILETEYVSEDYAAAVAKNNGDLLKKIDDAMTELKEDGTIDKIIAKYIKAE